jgi:hypothetical protein
MGPTWILTNKKECVVSTPKRSRLNPKSHITKLNWAVFLNEFNKLYILLLFDSVVNIPFENQSLIFFAKVKCRFSYSVYDKPTKPLYFFNLYEWMNESWAHIHIPEDNCKKNIPVFAGLSTSKICCWLPQCVFSRLRIGLPKEERLSSNLHYTKYQR